MVAIIISYTQKNETTKRNDFEIPKFLITLGKKYILHSTINY